MGTITAGLRNIDSVGLEMRVEDATKLTTFIEIRGARVILWTRNDAEEVKINGFNPELLEGGRSGGGHAERGAP
jgi:hypothetical protein